MSEEVSALSLGEEGSGSEDRGRSGGGRPADAEVSALSRDLTAVPRLVATVRRLRAELAALRAELPSPATEPDADGGRSAAAEVARLRLPRDAEGEAGDPRVAESQERTEAVTRLEAEVERVRRQLEEAQAAHRRQLAEEREAFEQRRAAQTLAHRREIEAITGEWQRRLAAAEARAVAMEAVVAPEPAGCIADLEAEVEALRSQLAAVANPPGDPGVVSTDLAEYQDRVEELQRLAEDAQARAAAVERSLGEVLDRLAAKEAEVGRLTEELGQVRQAAEERTRRLAAEVDAARWRATETEQRWQRRLEDAEAQRRRDAAEHRRELERVIAEAEARAAELLSRLGEAEARLLGQEGDLRQRDRDLEQVRAELEAVRTDLDATRGELEAERIRLREQTVARQRAEEGRAQVEAEVEYLRSEVLAGGQRRGWLRRGPREKAPLPRRADIRPAGTPDAVAGTDLDEDAEALLERRLFGE